MNLLTRPAALIALAVLVVNDHVLKGAGVLPGWVTGKVSDFAGLLLAPLVLGALLGELRVSRRWAAALSGMAVAIGFSLVKVAPSVNQVVGWVWGPMVLDATDLLALPMCGVAWWFMARSAPAPRPPGRVFRLASLAGALLACAATSPAPAECHPSWRLLDPPSAIGCARVDAWVSKSGKEGVGVTLVLERVNPDESCQVRVDTATFQSGEFRSTAAVLPPPATLGDDETVLYLPFAFDNQALWQASLERTELRNGILSVQVTAGAVSARWNIRTLQEIHPRHTVYGEGYRGSCVDNAKRPRPRRAPRLPFIDASVAAPRDAGTGARD